MIVVAYCSFERYWIAKAGKLTIAELQTKLAQVQMENLRLQVQPHLTIASQENFSLTVVL